MPLDYLEWVANGCNDLSADVKFSARYWLEKRVADQAFAPQAGAEA